MSLMEQMFFAYAHIYHIPGKNLVFTTLTHCIEEGVGAAAFKCLVPSFKPEVICPRFKSASVAPYLLDHISHASVSTGQYSFDKACLRIMPVIYHVFGGYAGTKEIYTAEIFLYADLCFPLEGAVRLGDKAGGGDRDLHSPVFIRLVLLFGKLAIFTLNLTAIGVSILTLVKGTRK